MSEQSETRKLPVLPMKSSVLFPHQMLPLVVGRPTSVAAVEAAMLDEEKSIVVVSQLDEEIEEPTFKELFPIGTLAVIKKMARSESVIQIIVQGVERVRLEPDQTEQSFLQANVTSIVKPDDWDTKNEALHREVLDLASRVLEQVNPEAQPALLQMVDQIESPLHQVYVLSSLLSLKLEDEQKLLSAETQAEALRLTHDFLSHEIKVLEVRRQISDQAQTEMSREPSRISLAAAIACYPRGIGASEIPSRPMSMSCESKLRKRICRMRFARKHSVSWIAWNGCPRPRPTTK